jgi:hypothetical protein
MTTVKEETLAQVKTIYRLHDVEPGFQITEGATMWQVSDAVEATIRASRTLERNAVKRCNGIERYDAKARMVLASWTDADEASAERSDDRAEAKVKAALAVIYGATWGERIDLETSGDPRGAMVKLWTKGSKDKGWARLTF